MRELKAMLRQIICCCQVKRRHAEDANAQKRSATNTSETNLENNFYPMQLECRLHYVNLLPSVSDAVLLGLVS